MRMRVQKISDKKLIKCENTKNGNNIRAKKMRQTMKDNKNVKKVEKK